MRRREFLTCLTAALLPVGARAATLADDARVQAFIAEMRDAHAFSPFELSAFFSRLSVNDRVLRLIGTTAKPAKKVYWREYRKLRLTAENIAQGVKFHRDHDDALRRAEADYGVPAAVATAIIGIETRYGEITGNFRVAEALATLAFAHPSRGDEFRAELADFLIYAREARIDPMQVRGSYAGAFGIPQFLPSSIRRFAVDFDADGRIDLFGVTDAVGSVGRFLKQHGWRRGIDISYPATMRGDADALIEETAEHEYRPVFSYADLSARGVSAPAAPADAEQRYVFVDLENRYDDEYRLGTDNFYALTRYNRSFKYAAAVTDLAAAVAGAL